MMITETYPTSASPAVVVPNHVRAERSPRERAGKGQILRVEEDVQRVIGGLTLLSKAGDIAQDQADAAQRWYKDYVMGIIGAHDPEARRSGKAPDLHAAMLSRTEAIGRCKTVRHSLGLCGEVRLRLLLVDELSFSAIAAILLPGDVNGRKKVAAQMVLLLQKLTELYDRIDRAKMKRPST
jgi:hypothetical protein